MYKITYTIRDGENEYGMHEIYLGEIRDIHDAVIALANDRDADMDVVLQEYDDNGMFLFDSGNRGIKNVSFEGYDIKERIREFLLKQGSAINIDAAARLNAVTLLQETLKHL